jgi:type II secretory ATPase GspE/PulE/Tfp pilus assembly ATPase PilB-like protein
VQQLIVANGTSDNIQATAIKEGMITMQLDGFIKALRGETTIEEILRVTSQG